MNDNATAVAEPVRCHLAGDGLAHGEESPDVRDCTWKPRA